MAKMSDEMKAMTALLRLVDSLEVSVAERLLGYAMQKVQGRRAAEYSLKAQAAQLIGQGNGLGQFAGGFSGHQQ